MPFSFNIVCFFVVTATASPSHQLACFFFFRVTSPPMEIQALGKAGLLSRPHGSWVNLMNGMCTAAVGHKTSEFYTSVLSNSPSHWDFNGFHSFILPVHLMFPADD